MNNKKIIILGIIGCGGRIGKIHTNNVLSNFPDIKVKSVCDINIDKIKDWAYSLGIKNIFTDFRDIIDDPEINTVFICSPTPTHVDYIIEAANAGKNIFCEKPIDLDPKRIKKALDIVKKAGVKLQIGFMKRFDQHYMELRKIINEGKIGKQYTIRITSRDPVAPPHEYVKTSGGLFQDMTCHDFDNIRYITGSEIEELYTIGTVLIKPYFRKEEDYDTAIINLKFKNGAIGTIENSREANYGYDQRIEVFGSKGCVFVNNPKYSQVTLNTKDVIINNNPKFFFLERYMNAYIEEFRQFFNAILNGKDIPATGLDGLKTVLIAIAAQKSAKENKPIKVDYSMCY